MARRRGPRRFRRRRRQLRLHADVGDGARPVRALRLCVNRRQVPALQPARRERAVGPQARAPGDAALRRRRGGDLRPHLRLVPGARPRPRKRGPAGFRRPLRLVGVLGERGGGVRIPRPLPAAGASFLRLPRHAQHLGDRRRRLEWPRPSRGGEGRAPVRGPGATGVLRRAARDRVADRRRRRLDRQSAVSLLHPAEGLAGATLPPRPALRSRLRRRRAHVPQPVGVGHRRRGAARARRDDCESRRPRQVADDRARRPRCANLLRRGVRRRVQLGDRHGDGVRLPRHRRGARPPHGRIGARGAVRRRRAAGLPVRRRVVPVLAAGLEPARCAGLHLPHPRRQRGNGGSAAGPLRRLVDPHGA